MLKSFFNKVAGLKPAILFEKELQLHSSSFCFHVNLKTILMEMVTPDNTIFRELEGNYVIPSTNVLKPYFCSLPLSFWIRELKL